MTSVARLDVENLPGQGRTCQPGTTRRPRHDWSMRLLGGNRPMSLLRLEPTQARAKGDGPIAGLHHLACVLVGAKNHRLVEDDPPCTEETKDWGVAVGEAGGDVTDDELAATVNQEGDTPAVLHADVASRQIH